MQFVIGHPLYRGPAAKNYGSEKISQEQELERPEEPCGTTKSMADECAGLVEKEGLVQKQEKGTITPAEMVVLTLRESVHGARQVCKMGPVKIGQGCPPTKKRK